MSLGFILSLSLLTTAPSSLYADDAHAATITGIPLPFYVFHSYKSPLNRYAPSGWMGDHGDISLNPAWKPANGKGRTGMRIAYSGQGRQGNGWAGIYWQNPPNNWGTKPGGYNLNGARKVTFWARGEKGGETIDQFKIGGIQGHYADSGSAGMGPVQLTQDWKQYEINLEGQELSHIAGGFCWTMTRDANPEGAIFYLDQIRYE
jgi:hypothetical protein